MIDFTIGMIVGFLIFFIIGNVFGPLLVERVMSHQFHKGLMEGLNDPVWRTIPKAVPKNHIQKMAYAFGWTNAKMSQCINRIIELEKDIKS